MVRAAVTDLAAEMLVPAITATQMLESMIDAMAARLGIDPLAFRMRNRRRTDAASATRRRWRSACARGA